MGNKILYILMVLAMIAWGETWISAKVLSKYLESDELIFWRFLFTSMGLLPILIYKKISFKITNYNLFISIVCATLLALYNITFFLGTKYGLASFGGVFVTTLNPIITFILIYFLVKKVFKIKEIIGLLLGIIGALIMIKIWNFNIDIIINNGNAYYLFASFLWPILTIVSAKQKEINSLVFVFYMFLFTAILDFIYLGLEVTNIFALDFKFWINILVLSLYGTTFATTVYFIGVKNLGSKIASSFFFLVPASTIFFSVIFLKEKIEISLMVGGILTMLSVYILNDIKTR
jgi:drug/metabolite transporter (DMT)-like permease